MKTDLSKHVSSVGASEKNILSIASSGILGVY